MGHRTVKRVALDFTWPEHKVWKGYLNPHGAPCKSCEGGQTHAAWALYHLAHLLLIAGENSLYPAKNFPSGLHPWLTEAGVKKLSPEMADLTTALVGHPPSTPLGYDSGANYTLVDKILTAAGIEHDHFYKCKTCKGTGLTPETQAAHDAWKNYEPPAGPGWQLWETVSEGSPISPVFKAAEALAEYAAAGGAILFPGETTSKQEWLTLILSDNVEAASFGVIQRTPDGHMKMTSAKDIVLADKAST
jgi:hypothetical protein